MTIDLQTFRSSLEGATPPPGLTPALEALWWDAKGDWDAAHEKAQERDDAAGAHVHAYLHRKEGDQSNAGYWYRRANVSPSRETLDAEWDQLVRKFLA